MIYSRFLCAVTFAAASLVAVSSTSRAGSVQRNVAYGPDPLETMNIWTPPAGVFSSPRPLVILIHGGSFWYGQADGWMDGRAGEIASRGGFVVANINYRLTGYSTAQIEDVQLALRFMRANAVKYGVDKSYACMDGWSAGATLAMAAGFTDTILAGDRANLYPTELVKVNCVADNSGPTGMVNSGRSILQDVSKSTPSAYITQGVNDPTVNVQNAQALVAALKAASIAYWVHYYVGGHVMHGLTTAQQQAIYNAEIAFFGKTMYF